MLNADNDFYSIVCTEVVPELQNNPRIEIYFNERVYNLFVGLPCTYMTKHGNLNYKLKVAMSRAGLFEKTITDIVETIVGGVSQSTIIINVMVQQKYIVLLCGTL